MEMEGVKPATQELVFENDLVEDKEKRSYVVNDPESARDEKNSGFMFFEKLQRYREEHHQRIIHGIYVFLLAGYFVYFGFAMQHHKGDEDSWRLIGITICGVVLLSWRLINMTAFGLKRTSFSQTLKKEYNIGNRSRVVRWFLYIAMATFMIVYIVIAVAMKTPDNLRALIGLFGFPVLLFAYSNNKRKVNWHTVFWGLALQFIFALLVLKTTWGASIIQWCSNRVQEFLSHTHKGSEFVFDNCTRMIMIITISVLTYLEVIKFLVESVGRVMAFALQLSPPEGINVIGNVFLFIPECVLVVQEYFLELTPSQLFLTYAGSLATVGGTSLVTFMSFGVPAAPLIAASVMSAPATIAACKLAFPSHKDEVAPKMPSEVTQGDNSMLRKPTSITDAIFHGIQQSVPFIVQIIVCVLTFVILLEFLSQTLSWFGDRVGKEGITLEFVFSYVFYPFAFMMGARAQDCLLIGKVLGIRTFSFAIYGYLRLGQIIQNGVKFRQYVSENVNNTWTATGDDIFLTNWNTTITGGVLEERSEIIATYALCGSACFPILGFVIGSFNVMLPYRSQEVTNHILRAMIVGTVASYMTACFAGLLYEEEIV